jgi:hypothetical protein
MSPPSPCYGPHAAACLSTCSCSAAATSCHHPHATALVLQPSFLCAAALQLPPSPCCGPHAAAFLPMRSCSAAATISMPLAAFTLQPASPSVAAGQLPTAPPRGCISRDVAIVSTCGCSDQPPPSTSTFMLYCLRCSVSPHSPLRRGDVLRRQPSKRLSSHRFHACLVAGSCRCKHAAPCCHAARFAEETCCGGSLPKGCPPTASTSAWWQAVAAADRWHRAAM